MSRLAWVEVRGFRAFGAEVRRFEFTSDIVVIHAPNSQGKTSFFEAIEFLFTGSTSRRALLGSATAEFEGSMQNVHIGPGSEVSVTAGVVTGAGQEHVVRRILDEDCTGQRDCVSTLTVDGLRQNDLPTHLGIVLSAPPIAAPVMFQHTLRYVMSARPQERVEYFKNIFELEGLDRFRAAVAQLQTEYSQSDTPRLDALARSPRGRPVLEALKAGAGDDSGDLAVLYHAIAALDPALSDPERDMTERDVTEQRLAALAEAGKVLLKRRRKARSPLPLLELPQDALLAARQDPQDVDHVAIRSFTEIINEVDQAHARLVPMFERALALPDVSGVQEGEALDCPLCLTPDALTHTRLNQIRAEMLGLARVTEQSRAAGEALRRERDQVRALWRHAAVVPAALDGEGMAELVQRLGALGLASDTAAEALAAAARVKQTGSEVRTLAETYGAVLASKIQDVADHRSVDPEEVIEIGRQFRAVVAAWRREVQVLTDATVAFNELVSAEVDASLGLEGWADLIDAADNISLIQSELAADRRRQAVLATLDGALADIDTGIQIVLDQRFQAMSKAINRWWLTLRPEEELLGFSGMRRRGAGRRFLDIKAALRPRLGEPAVERDAVAVGSDSQLNALGLATFLARTRLTGSGWVALDDAVPGSDVEHRSTFASNTVRALHADGLQVLIATHDSELARLIVELHRYQGVDQFELALDDGRVGPALIKVSDRFEERLAAGKGLARSALPDHRRRAASDLRTAGEVLAKAIIAAGRRAEGTPAGTSDLDGKNLAALIDYVLPHVVMSEEPGYWQALRRLLNPGSHDDPHVPTTNDLATAAGYLRSIHREHKAKQASFRTD